MPMSRESVSVFLKSQPGWLPLSQLRTAFLPAYTPDPLAQRRALHELINGMVPRSVPAWRIIEGSAHEDLRLLAGPLNVLVYRAGTGILKGHFVFTDPSLPNVTVDIGASMPLVRSELASCAGCKFPRELKEVRGLLIALGLRLAEMLDEAILDRRAIVWARQCSLFEPFRQVQPDQWPLIQNVNYEAGTATTCLGEKLFSIHIQPVLGTNNDGPRTLRKRGPQPKYPRQAILDYILKQLDDNGLPHPDKPGWRSQSDVLEAVESFCQTALGKSPKETYLKGCVREAVSLFEQLASSGGR
ncbi:hypothetical protein [Microvirga sp. P5_D2]